ncbi:MAG: hypothetical protein MHMPM18_000152 [Marteilia pararefringens]
MILNLGIGCRSNAVLCVQYRPKNAPACKLYAPELKPLPSSLVLQLNRDKFFTLRCQRFWRKQHVYQFNSRALRRINASCIKFNFPVDEFFQALKRENILLSYQSLSLIAIYEPQTFLSLIKTARKSCEKIGRELPPEPAPAPDYLDIYEE